MYRNFRSLSSGIWSGCHWSNTITPREVVMWNQNILVERKKDARQKMEEDESWVLSPECCFLPINNFEKLFPFSPRTFSNRGEDNQQVTDGLRSPGRRRRLPGAGCSVYHTVCWTKTRGKLWQETSNCFHWRTETGRPLESACVDDET
jgi:hypothetical protein